MVKINDVNKFVESHKGSVVPGDQGLIILGLLNSGEITHSVVTTYLRLEGVDILRMARSLKEVRKELHKNMRTKMGFFSYWITRVIVSFERYKGGE